VTTYAVDIAPDGGETLIQVPDEKAPHTEKGNPANVEGNPLGRWRFQASKLVPVVTVPLTREYRVEHSNGVYVDPVTLAPIPVCNGLIAGQFQLPMFDFITPEHTVQGSPQYPGNFQNLGFLHDGSGPLFPGGPNVLRLDPWPGRLPSNQPAP
jgi:hypothetical protein